MELLAEYGIFVLKSFTIVFALLLLIAGIITLSRKTKPKLEIISLTKHYLDVMKQLQKAINDGKLPKKIKKEKNKDKQKKPTLYVIDFAGDIKASQVDQLREEISAVLSVATQADEVVVRVESGGGTVNGYGLAAAQLQRVRDHHIPLTVCIDKVAASGGYLMACVANQIVAAPFAIIGSIGVVAQLPNFHRWLKKNDIDVELLTAGEYKRTLTMFAENTDKGRKKFLADLEQIHHSFKDYVLANRHELNMEKVATGEHWIASDAMKLQLVDLLKTSDDYLISKMNAYHLLQIKCQAKQSLINKILNPAVKLLQTW